MERLYDTGQGDRQVPESRVTRAGCDGRDTGGRHSPRSSSMLSTACGPGQTAIRMARSGVIAGPVRSLEPMATEIPAWSAK